MCKVTVKTILHQKVYRDDRLFICHAGLKFIGTKVDIGTIDYDVGTFLRMPALAGAVSIHRSACVQACSSRPVLRSHVRMVHREARTQRNHVCDVCGKTYTTKKSLEGHLRAHAGARPFRCTRCPSAFGYEAALYNHTKLVHLKGKTNRSRRSVQGTLIPPGSPTPAPPHWDATPTAPHTAAIS